LVLVVLVVAAVYAAVIGWSVRRYSGNLSALIDAGELVVKTEPGALGHHIIVFRNSIGYDGLAYYNVAADPFLQRTFRDAFRYQRIGYPLVVWAVSLGQQKWRPVAMVGVNVVAVLVVAYLSGLIILLYGEGASVWWALACAVNPSLIIGVQRDLAEPLTVALALVGLWLYLRQRIGWSAVALAAAMLTREVAILFIVPLVVGAIGARRIRRAMALALAVVPYVIWQLILERNLGHAGVSASTGQFVQPLMGIRAVVVATLHATPWHKAGWASVVAVMMFVFGVVVVSALLLLRRRYDVVVGSMLVHAVAALFAASSIWLGFASAARVFGGLYPLTVFAFAHHRTRPLALLIAGIIALSLFTLIRFAALNPPEPYYVTP
jgi:hypothetical protein